MMKKVSYMGRASLSEYVGNSRDPDEKFLRLFVRENNAAHQKSGYLTFGLKHIPSYASIAGSLVPKEP